MSRLAGRYGRKLAAAAATVALTAAAFLLPAKAQTDPKAVIKTYDGIAFAGSDSLDAPDKVFQ